jgi:hypothetical protein
MKTKTNEPKPTEERKSWVRVEKRTQSQGIRRERCGGGFRIVRKSLSNNNY